MIVFGDAIKGEAVRKLVAFGDSLGVPVKYVCLVDYSNSRGASDMGLTPRHGPGYRPVSTPGLAYDEILAVRRFGRAVGGGSKSAKARVRSRRPALLWC